MKKRNIILGLALATAFALGSATPALAAPPPNVNLAGQIEGDTAQWLVLNHSDEPVTVVLRYNAEGAAVTVFQTTPVTFAPHSSGVLVELPVVYDNGTVLKAELSVDGRVVAKDQIRDSR